MEQESRVRDQACMLGSERSLKEQCTHHQHERDDVELHEEDASAPNNQRENTVSEWTRARSATANGQAERAATHVSLALSELVGLPIISVSRYY